MKDLQIAQTIASQIGNRALFMIGAKNLAGTEDSLHMKIGRNPKNITHITIKLTSDDLYTIRFLTIRKNCFKLKAEHEGIYADMLNQMIESETGLYTSL